MFGRKFRANPRGSYAPRWRLSDQFLDIFWKASAAFWVLALFIGLLFSNLFVTLLLGALCQLTLLPVFLSELLTNDTEPRHYVLTLGDFDSSKKAEAAPTSEGELEEAEQPKQEQSDVATTLELLSLVAQPLVRSPVGRLFRAEVLTRSQGDVYYILLNAVTSRRELSEFGHEGAVSSVAESLFRSVELIQPEFEKWAKQRVRFGIYNEKEQRVHLVEPRSPQDVADFLAEHAPLLALRISNPPSGSASPSPRPDGTPLEERQGCFAGLFSIPWGDSVGPKR